MNPREQRSLVIAALCKLKRENNGEWIVPSQTGADKAYRVSVPGQTCTCPDHQEHREEAGFKCKHIYAAEFTTKREVAADGTVTETNTITFTEKKVYKQDWPAYNAAQSVEKDRFQELLCDLCKGVAEPEHKGKGRVPHPICDRIFAIVYKVYSTFSARRFSSDLREAHERGFTTAAIPGMKTTAFMEEAELTPILKALIAQSALPLKTVETKFAIDSSGFGSNKFERWFDQKYGVTRQKCVWVKCHIACGVKTNIVTAIRILDKDAGDSPQFAPMVKDTARNFAIDEFSADKAYTSLENLEAVAECGGTAYLPFKSNHTGAVGGLFAKMLGYFQFKQEEYMAHYHLRSNIESTFSMIKRKMGDAVRSKTDVAMVNEVLCKVLAHNLCVLIQEEHELGIDNIFWKEPAAPEPGQTVIRFPTVA